ncbi:MAG: tryptophan synthase subunit beta [Bdellovibrionales bacterium]|nr:tryptophan synthase subunit beta [Bdellovibrionales bacterium]
MKVQQTADEHGYYGEFGGQFVPELLYPNVRELAERYQAVLSSQTFQQEYRRLLREYAGRPTPLYPATRLSERYGTQVYIKREDLLHTGAHKINNTLGQILLAKELGKTRVIAETGAGQHGVATATVCALMGLPCVVYMGALDVQRQEPNVCRMRMMGAEVVPVESGSRTLKDATNEALRDWINNPEDTYYLIGSVVGPHPYPDLVARLHAVTSDEIAAQLQAHIGRSEPDIVIACVGGGSNAIGAFSHFLDKPKVRLIGVEAAGKGVTSGESAATTALGSVGVLHGSKSLVMQTEDGQIVEAHSISAGLDYPGIGPQHAYLRQIGRAEYVNITDRAAVDAALLLARTEGIIPALESAHAFAYLEELHAGPDDVVVVNCSGRGDKDMATYMSEMAERKLF